MRRWIIVAAAIAVLTTRAWATETVTYTYDALGRLVKVLHTGSVNNNQQTVYAIDPADNRKTVTTTGASH